MVKSKNIFKRTLAILLAIIFVIAIPLSVNADTVTVNSMPQCIDSNGQYMTYVQNAYSSDDRKVCEQGDPIWTIYIGAAVDKNRAYCIEPGGKLSHGNTLDTSNIWKNFSRELQKSINLTLLYGLNGSPEKLVGNSDEKYVATQLIIWELVDGYRELWNSNLCFARTNSMYYDSVCSNGANVNVAKNYEIISNSLKQYSTLPSFSNKRASNAPILTLNWDGSKYTTTVTDTNNVLDQFNFSADGITFTRNGNQLTISTDKFIDDAAVASSRKSLPEADTAAKLIAYGSPNRQDIVTGVESESDPPMAYFRLETTESRLKIVKRDKETKEIIPLEGFGFKITDSKGNYLTDGDTDTWYTDITGSVSLPLTLDMDVYYIEEVTAVGDYSVNPTKQRVVLDGEKIRYKGKVIYTGVTGVNGKLANVPKLIHGIYTYRELTAPEGYLLDENTYTFAVDGSKKVIELVMENKPFEGGIEITKTDITTDKALPNCGIRLLDENGNILLEKKTDANGKVLFDKLKAGIYYYQEFDAPEGYQINTEKFKFEIKENGVIIKAVLKDVKITETPSTPTAPTTPTTPNAPEAQKVATGQNVHTSAFIITLIISAGVILFTKRKFTKDYTDKEN